MMISETFASFRALGGRHLLQWYPGGEEEWYRQTQGEAIMNLVTTLAGYRYRYPNMSDVAHKGPLTRPDQLELPERKCRFPAAKRLREPVKRTTVAQWAKREAQKEEEAKQTQNIVTDVTSSVVNDQQAENVKEKPSARPVRTAVNQHLRRLLKAVRSIYHRLKCSAKKNVQKNKVNVESEGSAEDQQTVSNKYARKILSEEEGEKRKGITPKGKRRCRLINRLVNDCAHNFRGYTRSNPI